MISYLARISDLAINLGISNKWIFTYINCHHISKIKHDQTISKISDSQRQLDQKQKVLKTYLQIIPPYQLQILLKPQKTDLQQYFQKHKETGMSLVQSEKLYKKLKKSAHLINIQNLCKLLQIIEKNQSQNNECKSLNQKIYNKIINTVVKKVNILSLQQMVDFMYRLVKMNYKQFQLMKNIQKIIIQEKIKINYPLIRKILYSYTHLDAGSSVLYSHISKTIKIGQHELSPIELAQSAYMLSKASQNASGGYGVFLIAQKSLLSHFPRLQFHELVKAATFMLTQNIGTNQFQIQLEKQLYDKYPAYSSLKINDLVALLKATSAYYFKYKDKALLNLLITSTKKLSSYANLQQFQDIVWSWGRAAKGDKQLWGVLQQQISKKHINTLKPRQIAFFYYSFCATQFSSPEMITVLQKKFMELLQQSHDVDEHLLIKFLLGMQKRKDFSQQSFVKASKLIANRFAKLSIKQLITFVKIINQSDICYENKQKFKQMQQSLLAACKSAISSKIYMFRNSQIVQILYMWIKLDMAGHSRQNQLSSQFIQVLFSQLQNQLNQIPKSAFIKAIFCFTIKDRYKQSIFMIRILQQLTKYGPVAYFFSPYQLPLLAYCAFHVVVNSNSQVNISLQLMDQLGVAIEKVNPKILNKFVRNGYEQTLKLKNKYENSNSTTKYAKRPKYSK